MKRLLGLGLLIGCARNPVAQETEALSETEETADTTDTAETSDTSAPPDTDLPADTDLPVDTDLPEDTGPSAEDCFTDWADFAGTCSAPVISSSWVGNGCVGTTGWFIEGDNFQFRQDNDGIADYGPQSMGANGNQMHWNVITPTLLCVTVFAGFKDTWVDHEIYVVNPDGKASNSVVVQDYL